MDPSYKTLRRRPIETRGGPSDQAAYSLKTTWSEIETISLQKKSPVGLKNDKMIRLEVSSPREVLRPGGGIGLELFRAGRPGLKSIVKNRG
jgi:hypothetical protein